MAVKVYKNNTWVDVQGVKCPTVNGVRSDAQAVRVYRGGAWVDVWTSMKMMTLLSNSISKGTLYVYDDGGIQFAKSMMSGTGSIAGGGTMVFYLDGEWVNPTITFDYAGNYMYEVSNGNYVAGSAGSISIYHRVKGATSAGTTTVLSKVGTDISINDGVERGTASKTLSGTYDRLGISITIPSYSGSYSYAVLSLSVEELKVGTTKLGFPMSAEFSYQY